MKCDVLLVSMPFGPLFWPSLGLSLLKAGLEPFAVPTRVRYFTFDFARRIGPSFYSFVAQDARLSLVDLPGEWVFSSALFDTSDEESLGYLDAIGRWHAPWAAKNWVRRPPAAMIKKLIRARSRVPAFLDQCLDEIQRASPRIVGFTSMFQQHVASLALARRIKANCPETFVVMGGPNCEGVMGLETVRQFPFVDAVVSGEGEAVFPQLVRRVLDGEPVADLPGVRTAPSVRRPSAAVAAPGSPMIQRMDDLPYPQYDDYFRQFRSTDLRHEWQPTLLFETSRGCWWGEKSHCTFCGLNAATMAYRSKSPERALEELVHLTETHPGLNVWVVDNILDMGYFRSFLPELARRDLGLKIYFETKSNLRKDQVRMLRDAGVRRIQPGIESLSDSVLALMRKGVGAFQNMQLLKWAKEIGIELDWNFLWGFPDEDPEEYRRMARLIPLLVHLPPPELALGILLDRFSPNYVEPERFGFTEIAPFPSLKHIYPLTPDAVRNLAYHFTFQYREPRDVAEYVSPLVQAIRWWKRHHASADLFSVDVGGACVVWDLRPGVRRLVKLHGVQRALFDACDAARELKALVPVAAEAAANSSDPADMADWDVAEVARRLQPLVDAGLMIQHGSRIMSLALPLGEYSPKGKALERFHRVVRSYGQSRNGRYVVPVGISTGRGRRKRGFSRTPGRAIRLPPSARLDATDFMLDDAGNLEVRLAPPRSRSGVAGR